ncbi:hypothetical protein ACFVT1_15295 [Streptomyces sp. NPDC057963]|uniref:hypothetical protein n=1 Tax=Streptomyces sp. NPDC057963 TaxID=3346290 RepID=UPI0036E6743F
MVEFVNPRYGVNKSPSDRATSDTLDLSDPEGLGADHQESIPESHRKSHHCQSIHKNVDSSPRAHPSSTHTSMRDDADNFHTQPTLIPGRSPVELHAIRLTTPRRRGVRPHPEQGGLPGHPSPASADSTAMRPEHERADTEYGAADAEYRAADALDGMNERCGDSFDGTPITRLSMGFRTLASAGAHQWPERLGGTAEAAPAAPRQPRRESPMCPPGPVRVSGHYYWIYSSHTTQA